MIALLSDEVRWGRTLIRYGYRFGARSTLAISVHPDLRVEVVAPEGTSLERIRGRVIARAPWIQRTRREFELLLPGALPRSFVNGESHLYLGRRYRLRAERGETDEVRIGCGRIHVVTRAEPKPANIERLLTTWYRAKAQEIFAEHMASVSEVAALAGIPPHRWQIRRMRSRWGSCSPSGLITLNCELIKAPPACIDYVVAHELCHLREPHHGARFWRLLEKVMPDYSERRAKLQQFAEIVTR